MTPNKPDPTNGEEKMREELQFEIMEDYIYNAKMSYLAIDKAKDMERMRGHFDKLVAFILAQLKQSNLALLEQMIAEMPKKEKITKKELNDPIAYYKTGRNETIDLINTDLRTKIEELKKTI